MNLQTVRRARARALVVPAAWSLTGWVVVAETVLAVHGWPVVAGCVFLAVLVCTAPGERCVGRVLLRGRAPRLHQRHTLAPVAQVLMCHSVAVDGLLLLVGPGHGAVVTAVGERTVVVTRGLVEAVRSGQWGPVTAAAVIAHELGGVRAGLTRRAWAWTVFLLPWSVLVWFLTVLWGVVTTFVPARVMVACMVLSAAVGLWLGATEHPVHLGSTLVMGVAAWTWWSASVWQRARVQVGDEYLVRVGLAHAFAQHLSATSGGDEARDRVVRLQHPQPRHAGRSGTGEGAWGTAGLEATRLG
ncbi:hypothetical protein [Ornithinimicrobium cerasi]|uniref:Uncharacterized protein n=1 Tax=Ornithinimicrobium cerasi TaxID=2248773 RepID=A0A285VAH0_9MICO|nr:hypothetical protein [Ornithinimicrobium cerasi]SOC51115.1 hypothetical protein SAMN05421879_10132 [Ornithinimicrobium cerasi]